MSYTVIGENPLALSLCYMPEGREAGTTGRQAGSANNQAAPVVHVAHACTVFMSRKRYGGNICSAYAPGMRFTTRFTAPCLLLTKIVPSSVCLQQLKGMCVRVQKQAGAGEVCA